jgi:hypothetical protein
MTAIILLFAIGFGLVGLASAASETWPLLITPLFYAWIPYIVVHEREETASGPTEPSPAPSS